MSGKPRKLKQSGQENPGFFYVFPIAFVISVVPLVVFMKAVSLTPIEKKNWYSGDTYADFFTYYKSQWLLIGTIFAVIFFVIYLLSKKLEIKKSFIYIPTIVYALLIVLSTITSEYRQVAIRGFVARYEGMLELLCYIALMIVTFNLIKTESQIKYLLGALIISASIIGIIGLFQFLGYDLFRTDFGKKLILPGTYHEIAENLNFSFEESSVYSTLSNPNYIGSYMALLIPIAFISLLYFKNLYVRIGSGLLAAILTLNLFGSRSRAGLVGFCTSVALTLVIFRKSIFKRKFISLLSVASIAILFFFTNFVLNGTLTKRILSEFSQGNEMQFFDLQDIEIKGNEVSIVSSTEVLTIRNIDGVLSFYDGGDVELAYEGEQYDNGLVITFGNSKYKDYVLYIIDDNLIVNQKQTQFTLKATEETFTLVGQNGEETNKVEKAPSFGFKGKERLGSARGYIWSRTLPMLKDTLLIGYGPDTYAIKFPQNDYIGKIRAYGKTNIIVDKPHNMYLQIAVNTGILSLMAAIILLGYYIVQSLRLYKHMDNSFIQLTGAGIFLAICGYLVAALFNDSVVGVAPIFWILLGLGFVCNENIQKQAKTSL